MSPEEVIPMPNSKAHAIALCENKCTGCTNCIRVCPTEALRVKNQKAKIIEKRCINCGQCVSVCPHNALSGVSDQLQDIRKFPYTIALVDPVFYSQFYEDILDPQEILNKIQRLGFDMVYEVSRSAPIITDFTNSFIKSTSTLPVISSSCPAILRTIQIRFPDLIENILPMDSPAEIAADIAKEELAAKKNIPVEEIGAFYISTCPARSFSFKKPVGRDYSNVDGTLSIKDIFLKVSGMKENPDDSKNKEFLPPEFFPHGKAIGWARLGGQSQALSIKEFLSVDGIDNVISILAEMEDEKLQHLSFLECQACTNGCVGGNFCVENSFVARNRIRILSEKHRDYESRVSSGDHDRFRLQNEIQPFDVSTLDVDLSEALIKMEKINNVLETLPNIDCGACGSPSCKSLAEDIVLGYGSLKDCIVLLKENQ